MRYILKESQHNMLIETATFSSDVERIQKVLVSKGYDLGKYGPNKDGVDGLLGPLTRKAVEKEFGLSVLKDIKFPEKTIGGYDAVLVGGLDYRVGDLKIGSQANLLKQGLGVDKKVKEFTYNTPTSTIVEFINQNQNIPVYLFSAGCRKSSDIASAMGTSKNMLYIIEPYALGPETKSSVRSAVDSGVPASNVFVGNSQGRGLGIVNGASSSKSSSHWNALTTVASMTKN